MNLHAIIRYFPFVIDSFGIMENYSCINFKISSRINNFVNYLYKKKKDFEGISDPLHRDFLLTTLLVRKLIES